MRCVSYTRLTSCFPFEEISKDIMEEQKVHIEAYAKSHGLDISRAYSDESESCEENAGFRELLGDGMARKFDCVVVDSIFRCGATLWEAREVFLETFQYTGIYFIVAEDDFNSFEKGNQEAEAYFKEKYREYKSRTTLYYNLHKNRPLRQKDPPSSPKRAVRPHVRSILAGIMYDKKTGARLNYRRRGDKGIFMLVGKEFGYRVKEENSILPGEAERKVLLALDREKETAQKALSCLEQGFGKEALDKKMAGIRRQMREGLMDIAWKEAEEVKLYHNFEHGEITLEEYESRRSQMIKELLLEDSLFRSGTDLADRWKSACSVRNPWIVLMLTWEKKEHLTRDDVKKYLSRVFVADFQKVEIVTQKDEWKQMLSELKCIEL